MKNLQLFTPLDKYKQLQIFCYASRGAVAGIVTDSFLWMLLQVLLAVLSVQIEE